MTEKVQVENTINLGKQLRRVEVGERDHIWKLNSREMYRVSNCLLYGEYNVSKG